MQACLFRDTTPISIKNLRFSRSQARHPLFATRKQAFTITTTTTKTTTTSTTTTPKLHQNDTHVPPNRTLQPYFGIALPRCGGSKHEANTTSDRNTISSGGPSSIWFFLFISIYICKYMCVWIYILYIQKLYVYICIIIIVNVSVCVSVRVNECESVRV